MKTGTLWVTVAAASCLGVSAADKPDFSGTWKQQTNGHEHSSAAISIAQDGKNLVIRNVSGPGDTLRIECNTVGKQCPATVDGEQVKVSFWYNGPKLVEMAIGGKNNDRVTETRRTLSDDGQKMTVEVIPISPAGGPEHLVFVREIRAGATTTTQSEARP